MKTLVPTWSIETTTVLSGRTADGSVVVFRPGRYSMKAAAGGAYELIIGVDSRIIFTADRISHLRATGELVIEGSWPSEP
jgi:hypothetical protein